MLEVKRKQNDSQRIRGAGSSAVRPSQQTLTGVQPNPNSTEPGPIAPFSRADAAPTLVPVPKESRSAQTRMPVITGEADFKGTIPVDGIIIGQLGAHGGSLGVRQKSGSIYASQPELSGEISFRDMLRVNGHIAGTVYSKSGTLIVDASATVDAHIEVGTAIISGTVQGDIVAQERVELGATARMYGNIWTRSLAIRDGAVFDGVCNMVGG